MLVVEPPQEAKELAEEGPTPAPRNPSGAAEHAQNPSGSDDVRQSG